MLDAPIHFDGQTMGVICLEHIEQVRRWTPEKITYAGSLADLISHALVARDRKQAEEALRESEDLLNSIIENAPVGLPVKGPNQIVETSRSLAAKALPLWKKIHDQGKLLVLQIGCIAHAPALILYASSLGPYRVPLQFVGTNERIIMG